MPGQTWRDNGHKARPYARYHYLPKTDIDRVVVYLMDYYLISYARRCDDYCQDAW